MISFVFVGNDRSAAIPTGLQVNQGPDAVVQFLKGKIDEIMA